MQVNLLGSHFRRHALCLVQVSWVHIGSVVLSHLCKSIGWVLTGCVVRWRSVPVVCWVRTEGVMRCSSCATQWFGSPPCESNVVNRSDRVINGIRARWSECVLLFTCLGVASAISSEFPFEICSSEDGRNGGGSRDSAERAAQGSRGAPGAVHPRQRGGRQGWEGNAHVSWCRRLATQWGRECGTGVCPAIFSSCNADWCLNSCG